MKNSNLISYPLLNSVFGDIFTKSDMNNFAEKWKDVVNDISKKWNNNNENNISYWKDKVDYYTHKIDAPEADIHTDERYLYYGYDVFTETEIGTYNKSGNVKLPFPSDADTTTVRAEKKDDKIVITVDKKKKVPSVPRRRQIEVK